MTNEEKQFDENGRVIRENRSQNKREREKVKQLAAELIQLPTHQYPLLPIDNTLKEALILGKRLTNNALKRHMNFLTRLIIEQDEHAIMQAHQHINHPFLHSNAKMKQIEIEIQRLINDDNEIIAELLGKYVDFDVQYVRQLTREIKKQLNEQAIQNAEQVAEDKTLSEASNQENKKSTKPSKHHRKLRRYLQSLMLYYDPDEETNSQAADDHS